MQFIHLHCHTNYSLLRGASTPEALCRAARADGQRAIAMTDVNGLYGALPFFKAALENDLDPIVGAELIVERDALEQRRLGRGVPSRQRAVLLAKNQRGYAQMCRAITRRQLLAPPLSNADCGMRNAECSEQNLNQPLSPIHSIPQSAIRNPQLETFSLPQQLLEDSSDVIVMTDDIELLERLARERGARDLYALLIAGRSHRRLLDFCLRSGVRPIASADVYFASPADYRVHHLLRAIDLNTSLDGVPAKELARPDAYLQTRAMMERAFAHCPEALHNTLVIAEQCEFEFEIGVFKFPKYEFRDDEVAPVPPCGTGDVSGGAGEFGSNASAKASVTSEVAQASACDVSSRPGELSKRAQTEVCATQVCGTSFEYLKAQCYAGAERRYGRIDERAQRQIEHELEVIRDMGFVDYFLIVADIAHFVRDSRIPSCGRGSAANSIVSYCLGLTHVDPIKHNLFFERFLNRGRKDAPDIDLDFSWRDRDRVLQYVYQRWGHHRVAMISTHVTFLARGAVREIAKVLGLPAAEINKVSKRLAAWFSDEGIAGMIESRPVCKGLPTTEEPWRTIYSLAERIHGYPRHLGIHCGGIVIAPRALTDHLPLERAAKGLVVTQWDMYPVEDVGLVKIDLLGNRSLAVIDDACQAAENHHGVRIDYERFNPIDDRKTQELMRRAETMGCFYIESPAMRGLLTKLQCGDYDGLVAASSIIRPGISSSGMMRAYIERFHGAPFTYLHPKLKELLSETYGVMVYQEDVVKVAHAIAGMSLADADGLRKSMSKKRNWERIEKYKEQFVSGAVASGAAQKTALELWRQIESFAGYSFCKAHSASYALVSFQAAYLRAHYPAEFMAAVLSNYGGYYRTFAYIAEARRMGLKILLPDVNESEYAYTGRDDWIRVGLCQIEGMNDESRRAILAERQRNGSYRTFHEFLRRAPMMEPAPTPSEIESLIRCGAFDGISHGAPRPELMWRLLEWQSQPAAARSRQTPSLFEGAEETLPIAGGQSREYDDELQLAFEYQTLGFLVSEHPLYLFRDRIAKLNVIQAVDLPKQVGKRVSLVGWQVTAKAIRTIRGEPMEFISFEDTTGIYEATFFPREYRRFAHMTLTAGPYLITGKVEEDFGDLTVTVQQIELLASLPDTRNSSGGDHRRVEGAETSQRI